MMRNKPKTLEYIKILSEGTTLPFSIKVRAGLTQDDKEEQFQFLVDAAPYCKTISVHGRTYNQAHNGSVDRDFIYNLKKIVGNTVTVIGNGGINEHNDYKTHEGKVDGIMIGQAAMQNPRIFTPHLPSESEKITLSLHHLLLMGAYEIYMNYTRAQYPEMSDQLIINRQYLHLNKKYDPDSDEIQELPKIDFHDYLFPFPTQEQIHDIYTILEKNMTTQSETIIWKDTKFFLSELRC